MSELNNGQEQEAQGTVDAEAAADAEFAKAFSEAAGATDSDAEPGTGGEEDEAGQGDEEQGKSPAPAEGEDGAAAGGEPPVEDDEETLRRKAKLYDHNEGRLRETQERLRKAQADLEALRKPGSVQAEAKPLSEVPEDVREDVEAFGRANPEYAAFAVEDSKDGDRLRKALAEYGPDHVLVAEMADRIADKRGHLDSTVAAVEQAATEMHEAHFAAIHAAHPDYGALQSADLAVPENRAKLDAYKARLDAWAEAKPGKQYVEIQRIRERGTAQEVCTLLSRFKEETGPTARQERTRQAAQAAMAPRSKPSPLPVPKEDRTGSYKEGWDGAK